MTTKTFSRQQLYDRVWEQSVDPVARELGISNVGLGKLCRRNNIPVPPRGWWARKAAGYATARAPLPALREGSSERIFIQGTPTREVDPDEHPLIAYEKHPDNCVRLLDNRELTHPVVLKAARLLRRSKRDATGRVPSVAGGLHLYASHALHGRGLRVWQELLVAFTKRHVQVGNSGEQHSRNRVG
jgi:hypothetical protein